MGDGCGHDRGDDNGGQLGETEVTKNNFSGEQRPGHRRVESCGYPGRCPAADKGFHAPARDPEKLAEGRAEAGPDLDNRSFAAHRTPGADADG